jgi:transketolase
MSSARATPPKPRNAGHSIGSRETPSILALSRQAVPALRTEYSKDNLSAKGGYVLSEASSDPQVVLIGTGTETSLCIDAQKKLEEKGISTRVVSMPCTDLFAEQPKRYQDQVLGDSGVLRIAVEAGIGFGWERWIGENGIFIGMNGFGASAPAPELYKQFGITVDAIVKAASQ